MTETSDADRNKTSKYEHRSTYVYVSMCFTLTAYITVLDKSDKNESKVDNVRR